MVTTDTAHIVPVLLSGGQGTRLWPLSRAAWPKQFLPLAGEQSLFEDSLARIADDTLFARPIIVCAREHRFIIRDMLRAHAMEADIILEPCGRNTAPALAAAALTTQARYGGNARMLAMPVDHHIPDTQAFQECVRDALPACDAGRIALFGIQPKCAHTGFGYIRQGAAWDDHNTIFEIAEFREKPDTQTAQNYVDSGDCAWNAGIVLMRAGDYLGELKSFAPQVNEHTNAAWRNAHDDLGDIVLNKDNLSAGPAISMDHAVLEHSDKPCLIPADFEWHDLGSWDALMNLAARDDNGTAQIGNVMAGEVRNSYLHSTGPLLYVGDVGDIIAVATDEGVLVTRREQQSSTQHK